MSKDYKQKQSVNKHYYSSLLKSIFAFNKKEHEHDCKNDPMENESGNHPLSATSIIRKIKHWFKVRLEKRKHMKHKKCLLLFQEQLIDYLNAAMLAMGNNDAKTYHDAIVLAKDVLTGIKRIEKNIDLKLVLEKAVVQVILNSDSEQLQKINHCTQASINRDAIGIIFRKNVELKHQGYAQQKRNLDAFLDQAVQAMKIGNVEVFLRVVTCLRVIMISLEALLRNEGKAFNPRALLEDAIKDAIDRVREEDLPFIYGCSAQEIVVEPLGSILHEKAFLRDIDRKSAQRQNKLIETVKENTSKKQTQHVAVQSLNADIKGKLLKMLTSLKTDDPSVN